MSTKSPPGWRNSFRVSVPDHRGGPQRKCLEWLVGNLGASKIRLEGKKEREERLSPKEISSSHGSSWHPPYPTSHSLSHTRERGMKNQNHSEKR